MHDLSRSENGTLPADKRTIALLRGATQAIELRRGAAIVAVEGELLIRYRDAALASIGQLAPEQTLHLHEGEQYVARQRNCYAVSAARAPGARFLVQAQQRSARAAWLALSARLLRADAWLRARPRPQA